MEKSLLQAMLCCTNSLPEARQYHIHNSSTVAAQSGSFSRGIWVWLLVSLMLPHLSPQASHGWCIAIHPAPGPTLCSAGRIPGAEQGRTKLQSECWAAQSWATCSPCRWAADLRGHAQGKDPTRSKMAHFSLISESNPHAKPGGTLVIPSLIAGRSFLL